MIMLTGYCYHQLFNHYFKKCFKSGLY